MFRVVRRVLFPYLLVFIAAGTGLAIYLFYYTEESGANTIDVAVFYLVVSNFILIFLCVFILISYNRINARRKRFVERSKNKELKILISINHIFSARTGLTNYLLSYVFEGIQTDEYMENVRKYLQFSIDETRHIFDELTGTNCAVSVKLLVASPRNADSTAKAPLVKTYMRDSKSHIYRTYSEKNTEPYIYSEHSPFQLLIDSHELRGFFVCDDLVRAEKKGDYKNKNTNWRALYNATAIVPIADPTVDSTENLMGFLCVDNKEGGFDNPVTKVILNIVATGIYYVLFASSIIEMNKKKETVDGVSNGS